MEWWQDPINLYLVGALLAAVLLLLLSIQLWRWLQQRALSDKHWPYMAKRPLSEAERIVYQRLGRALPDHLVLAHVRLLHLLGVRKTQRPQIWLDQIADLDVDLVVCAPDGTALAVIQLLDNSEGSRSARREQDNVLSKALNAAGIRQLRWSSWDLPDDAEIANSLVRPSSVEESLDWLDKPLRATD